jgi:hypothetical protein
MNQSPVPDAISGFIAPRELAEFADVACKVEWNAIIMADEREFLLFAGF